LGNGNREKEKAPGCFRRFCVVLDTRSLPHY
jgi:hypothetical protein